MDLSKPIGNDPKFHREIRKFRESLGQTVQEFAETLGVTTSTVYGWENDLDANVVFRPGKTNREKLAKLMAANSNAATRGAIASELGIKPSDVKIHTGGKVGQVLAEHKKQIAQELGITLMQIKITVEF